MKSTRALSMTVAVTAILCVCNAAAASHDAAAPVPPKQLYQRLLTTSIPNSALPSGFSSAKIGIYTPSALSQKHHAVGGVEIDLNDGDDALVYIIFATRADAVADWKAADLRHKGKSVVAAPAAFPWPALIENSSITGKNLLGKTVTNGVTDLAFTAKNVIVQAVTRSTDNPNSGDIPATIKLGQFGLRHLQTI
jgi:hypothetical protein